MKRTIYVADDMQINVELVESVFGNDPNISIKKACNGQELLDSIENNGLPDLIILDLMMPEISGFDVLHRLQNIRKENYFPIIILSGLADRESIKNALAMDADDYIIKPFLVDELRTKVYNMLKVKEREEFLSKLISLEAVMESNLQSKLQMIEQTQVEIILRLGRLAEFRDNETGMHIERLSDFVTLTAEELGMNHEQCMMMRYASPMHDVGKISVPDKILLKPGKLTEDEFKIIKLHTIIGNKILGGTSLPLLELAREIAISHHERWDGNGYPLGLKGDDIPLSGRVVAVADVFDALTSERVYKTAWPIEDALDYIKEQRGRQFAPDVIDAFLNIADKIIQIKQARADTSASKPLMQQIIEGDISFEELVERWR